MKFITVNQPLAYLLFNKTAYTVNTTDEHGREMNFHCFDKMDVVNQKTGTTYRGPILIHAAKKVVIPNEIVIKKSVGGAITSVLHNNDLCVHEDDVQGGGIVGIAHLADCRDHNIPSPWWKGDGHYGYNLYFARALPFSPLTGGKGLRDVEMEELNIATQDAIREWVKYQSI